MRLNELKTLYDYSTIDSYICLAYTAHKFDENKELNKIKIGSTKENYISEGNVWHYRPLNKDENLFLAGRAYALIKEAIVVNSDIKYIEIGLRFLFEKNLFELFAKTPPKKNFIRFFPNLLCLKHQTIIEDVMLVFDEEEVDYFINSYYKDCGYTANIIKTIRNNLDEFIYDAKTFALAFIDLCKCNKNFKDLNILRKKIYNAYLEKYKNLDVSAENEDLYLPKMKYNLCEFHDNPNEVQIAYDYKRIDTLIIYALYGHGGSPTEISLINKEYNISDRNRYSSSGLSLGLSGKAQIKSSEKLMISRGIYEFLKEMIYKNTENGWLETAIRFLFDSNTARILTGNYDSRMKNYPFLSSRDSLSIEDIVGENNIESLIEYLYFYNNNLSYIIKNILLLKNNKEIVIEDAKAFAISFCNIYKYGISVKDLDSLRICIDSANEKAASVRGLPTRESEKLKEERERRKLQEIDEILIELETDFKDKISKSKPSYAYTNTCINAIINSIWVYWLYYKCDLHCAEIEGISGFTKLQITAYLTLAATRIKALSDDPFVLNITQNSFIELPNNIAIIADYYLISRLYFDGNSIETLKMADGAMCSKIAKYYNMKIEDVISDIDAINNYSSREFYDEFSKTLLKIIEMTPICKPCRSDAIIIWEKRNKI